jgi:hypothetical protein
MGAASYAEAAGNKSLFASFFSEKEESFYSIVFRKRTIKSLVACAACKVTRMKNGRDLHPARG